MSEKEFERIMKSIDGDAVPPQGLKEEMLTRILKQQAYNSITEMTRIERVIFEKPLKAACILSTLISGVLWAVMGNSYMSIVPNIIGIR